MIKLKMSLLVSLLAVMTTAGCTAMQPDQEYCQDLKDAASAIDQYANIDSPAAENEILEDLNEMGATERCPGYDPADIDADG